MTHTHAGVAHTHLGAAAGVAHAHAGQGSVLLDIGDDIGALVVTVPARLADAEIELRPQGASGRGPQHHPHVGVLARSLGGDVVYSAVFGAVPEGPYELYVSPDGPVELDVTVHGGHVTEATWPRA